MKIFTIVLILGCSIGILTGYVISGKLEPTLANQKACEECKHDLEDCQRRLYKHLTGKDAPLEEEINVSSNN